MKILWSFIAIAATTVASATAQLHYVGQRISDYLKDVPAEVGVAVATDRDETVFIGNDMRYPLMSVFKFHVALAVLDKMDRQVISPDTLLRIESSQLAPTLTARCATDIPTATFRSRSRSCCDT